MIFDLVYPLISSWEQERISFEIYDVGGGPLWSVNWSLICRWNGDYYIENWEFVYRKVGDSQLNQIFCMGSALRGRRMLFSTSIHISLLFWENYSTKISYIWLQKENDSQVPNSLIILSFTFGLLLVLPLGALF